MYIVNLNYQKSLDEVDLLLKAHIDWLKPYITNGTFIAAGRKNPITGGVFLVKDMPLPEIEQILQNDPFQAVASYDITQLNVGLTASGFELLKGI